MQKHLVAVRQVGQRLDFLLRVERAQLRRLADADGLGLRMVLEAETVKARAHQVGRQLAVGRLHRQQAATHHPLRRPALVHVDMRRLGTHHRLVASAHGVDAQHVGPRAVEHQVYPRLLTEGLLEQALQPPRIFVVAVSQRMVAVGLRQRLQHLGTHSRVVVASKSSFHIIL